MPERDSSLLIEDMLAAIRKIERYTEGTDQSRFQQDEKTVPGNHLAGDPA